LYGETTATAIDQEVKGLLERQYRRVGDVLAEHRADLDRIVDALLERETLHDDEFGMLLQGLPLPEPPPVHEPEMRPTERPSSSATERPVGAREPTTGSRAEPG